MGKRLKARGFDVVQVLNRHAAAAQALGEELQVAWSDHWSDIYPDADWVVLAVRDDAISEVAAAIAPFVPQALVTHTSGATSGTVLAPFFQRYGVFYPLQSFSAERVPAWSSLPFCVDAAQPADLVFLKKTAREIGGPVWEVNDEQRAALHVAAVFANNFANHCFAVAEALLAEKGLPFALLQPLLTETMNKALSASPATVQTGPAQRGDEATMQRQLDALTEHPAWHTIYEAMSESIRLGLP